MGSHTSKKHQLRVPKYDLSHFGVITVLFNPLKYKSRYELYHKFDEHMTRSGVTLLTVECIFETPEKFGIPEQKFEVTRANDPRHLQIKAPSVLWLKENLINIAVKCLPAYVEYVAWLDADIEFQRLDWPHLTIHELQSYSIVQLFELSYFLGPSGKSKVLRQDYSFAYAIRHQQPLDPRRSSECYIHPGYGWAMRRSTFDAIGGLLDFSILGSGDIHFAYALLNRIDETIPIGMHDDYRQVAQIWGQRVAQISGDGTLVGYVPVNIYHHWHGNRVHRGYFDRWSILENFQFSPLKDLEKNNHTGLLRLTDHQRLEAFEKTIISYFRSRNEDSLKKPIPAINPTVKNSKTRISSNDVVRPSNTSPAYYRTSWTTDINRTYNHDSDYIHLQDARSGYHPNEMNSFTTDITNYPYYPTYLRGSYLQPYHHNQDFRGQLIYYDDGNGNDNALSPGEISF